MDLLKKLLSSKRVQATIVTIVLVFFKENLNLDISEDNLSYIVGVVIALILGDSLRPVVPKSDAKPQDNYYVR